uniref:hypothetical protein n=1 Tax=Dyella soli TaxID=522319 RepID=UPI001F0F8470|nr:hypothetical protein [Dyella soli]
MAPSPAFGEPVLDGFVFAPDESRPKLPFAGTAMDDILPAGEPSQAYAVPLTVHAQAPRQALGMDKSIDTTLGLVQAEFALDIIRHGATHVAGIRAPSNEGAAF